MSPTPNEVLSAVRRSGVKFKLIPGWNDPKIQADGHWQPVGVLEHHTAGKDSLGWVVHDQYYPIRACHFLISRDGTVNVVYALKCYHAGMGGPTKVGNTTVPKDMGNGYFYGIEIESLGTSMDNSGANGYKPEQIEAAAKLTAALLDMLNAPTTAAMNHKDYAGRRKQDTLMSKEFWWAKIQPYRNKPTPGKPGPGWQYRQGKKVYKSKMKLGQRNSDSVWNLALALIEKGFGQRIRLAYKGPTNDYTPVVLECVKTFQEAQGWSGKNADGIPGPNTARLLGLEWVND